MNTPRIHLFLGLITFVTFLITGLYMSAGFPVLYRGSEATRFMYRANHIYILLAALLNLVLAAYLTPSAQRWKAKLQALGSIAFVVSVPILVYAFFSEPPRRGSERLLTLLGIVFLVLGTACHSLGGAGRSVRREDWDAGR